MILHNYCPHTIVIRAHNNSHTDYKDLTYASEGTARVDQKSGDMLYYSQSDDGMYYFPIYSHSEYGKVTGLPDPKSGHGYIVSMMVAQALPDRTDLLVPGSGPVDEAIRENGQIVAVTRLIAHNL